MIFVSRWITKLMNQTPSSKDSYSVDNKFCTFCRTWSFIIVKITVLCHDNTEHIHQATYTITSQTMVSLIFHHHAQNSPSLDPLLIHVHLGHIHHTIFTSAIFLLSDLPNEFSAELCILAPHCAILPSSYAPSFRSKYSAQNSILKLPQKIFVPM
jgi:hypothetical protein